MTSYSVACGIHATDNDHFQLAELRIAEAYIPSFVTGLRALLTGNVEMLRLMDARQKAVITGGVIFQIVFENGSVAFLTEADLCEMEEFALERLFGKRKPHTCLTLQLDGKADAQMSLSLWIGKREG